jgi:hypothetical protein
MADFFMHKTLVDQFLDQTLAEPFYAILGAQGPDYFYYVLNKKKAVATRIGTALHSSKTKAFLLGLTQKAIDQKSPELLDYVLGFLTHYALDHAIHPYIFHYSGVYRVEEGLTHQWAGLHLQFERKVDIAFIKHQLDFSPHKKNLQKEVLPLKRLPTTIETAIDSVVETVYGLQGAGPLFKKGYKTMSWVEYLLVYDPFKIKKPLLALITPYKKPRSLYYQDLSHAQTTDDFDYLNLAGTPWKHPVTGELFTHSVLDLYEAAKRRASELIDVALKSYQLKDTTPLAAVLRNSSYDTGLLLERSQTMVHFNDYRQLTQKKR